MRFIGNYFLCVTHRERIYWLGIRFLTNFRIPRYSTVGPYYVISCTVLGWIFSVHDFETYYVISVVLFSTYNPRRTGILVISCECRSPPFCTIEELLIRTFHSIFKEISKDIKRFLWYDLETYFVLSAIIFYVRPTGNGYTDLEVRFLANFRVPYYSTMGHYMWESLIQFQQRWLSMFDLETHYVLSVIIFYVRITGNRYADFEVWYLRIFKSSNTVLWATICTHVPVT